jgi:hypothetical protein
MKMMRLKTYCALNKLVQSRTLHAINVVKILDSDKLLKGSTSKPSLFKKFSFRGHVDSSERRGRNVHKQDEESK